jgi:hypothetical protein
MSEPVMIEIAQHHAFKKRATRGCAVCGRARTHVEHQGAPPSVRVLGSGDQFRYQALKKAWQDLLTVALAASELPRPSARVFVEGEVTFPDRIKRDQGNHRFLLEKALGDALVEGGWLRDDDWDRYEFGGLSALYEKGVSRTRLLLFPTPLDVSLSAASANIG